MRSIGDMDRAIVANLHRIPRDIDAIVGIPRSGMLAASMAALHLQLPLADLDGLCSGRVFRRSLTQASDVRRILLLDDTVLHGTAMTEAVAKIRARRPGLTMVRAAVYSAPVTPEGAVDLAFELLPGPRAFAWNLWKHKRLPRWAFDIDGVLCRDPTPEENDDGERYAQFLETVEPLFLPNRPIGHLVTCRRAKYRAQTQAWLAKHGVEYAGLFMMDKSAKMAAGGRAAWKAAIADTVGAELFIESDDRLAQRIAGLTKRPAWCTTTQRFYDGVRA